MLTVPYTPIASCRRCAKQSLFELSEYYILNIVWFRFTHPCWSFLFQMAAFNIQEALIWKEKIEHVIDQVCSLKLLTPTPPQSWKKGLPMLFLYFIQHLPFILWKDAFKISVICSIRNHWAPMVINFIPLVTNLGWITEGMVRPLIRKVSKYLLVGCYFQYCYRCFIYNQL